MISRFLLIFHHQFSIFIHPQQPTRFVPNLHNPNSSLNLHFQQQPSVVPPQQPLHQLHHLRHNEPETSTAIPSTSTINSLINAERIPSNQMLGLNAQEAVSCGFSFEISLKLIDFTCENCNLSKYWTLNSGTVIFSPKIYEQICDLHFLFCFCFSVHSELPAC